MQYKTKAVQTGIEVEITRYSKYVTRGVRKRPRSNPKNNKVQKELSKREKQKRADKSIRNSLSRTKTKLRQLINSNVDCIKFLTLTFNTEIYHLDISSPIFSKFTQRLKYRYPYLKYIAVPEFMPKSGRVHYHLLSNIPYIHENKFAETIWKNGFVKIKKIDEIKNLGAYMAKYLSKEHFDKRYRYKDKILSSTNCKKPKEYYGIFAEALAEKVEENSRLVYEKHFKENEYTGKTHYQVYDTRRLK